MATWYDTTALDALLNEIKTTCDEIWLLETYTEGQDWATVLSNKIGSAAITSGDFTGPVASTAPLDRKLTFNGATGAASGDSSGSPDLHIAIVNTSGSKVLAVTDETSDQVINDLNPITFPSFFLETKQPTQSA